MDTTQKRLEQIKSINADKDNIDAWIAKLETYEFPDSFGLGPGETIVIKTSTKEKIRSLLLAEYRDRRLELIARASEIMKS